ncbi:MAG TPA: monovalent cation/H+ antiporter subunit D family protein [Burkholderiales bacterium]|nr:monovalent cation/H+ antiporter subunit D family protein [Burkholderiales bacterium]
MTSHFPILQVVLPLLAAPVMVLARRAGITWLIAVAMSAAVLGMAGWLFVQTGAGETISYAIGSWPPPWGIEYRIDAANAYVMLLVAAIGLLVALYSRASIAAEIPADQHYLFYTMFALCLTGLLGMAATGDAFNLFVFLEIASLSTYVLIALGRDRRALVAAYQYLITGTIGASFIVIGVGLAYLETGTLNLADMATRLPDVSDQRSVRAALAFLTVGVSLKLALFPLHLWLPNAYTYAPSAVAAFLAATATKVAVYVLMRLYYSVFGAKLVFEELAVGRVLIALSLAAMVIASAVAIFQRDVKRMFAYSSIAQVGYITLGIGIASETGLIAGIVHLFNHALTKGAIFMLLGCIALRAGGVGFDRIAGIGRVMPLTSFGIVIGGLSLIGVPGTAGFVSKWYLVVAALEQGALWLAVLVVASSLLAIVYVWRFVEAAYFNAPSAHIAALKEAPAGMLALSWVMIAACIYFGLDTRLTLGGATDAAGALMRGWP